MNKQQPYFDPAFGRELLNHVKRQKQSLASIPLTQLHADLPHRNIMPLATYAPWVNDDNFRAAYGVASGHTLIDEYRMYQLYRLASQLATRPGCLVEVGVYKGGSSLLMAKAVEAAGSQSQLIMIDTFTGVVKTGAEDTLYAGGEHADTSKEAVDSLMKENGLSNYRIAVGICPEEARLTAGEEKEGISLCHIDVDAYRSGQEVFNYIWPLVRPGGVVIFDDYGIWGCEGMAQFCNSISEPDALTVYNLTGQFLAVKTPQ